MGECEDGLLRGVDTSANNVLDSTDGKVHIFITTFLTLYLTIKYGTHISP